MKKTKNTDLKENYSSLKHIQECKSNKNKQKIVKMPKDAIPKTTDIKLASKKQGTNFKKNSVKVDKNKKKEMELAQQDNSIQERKWNVYEATKSDGKMSEKQKKNKEFKDKSNRLLKNTLSDKINGAEQVANNNKTKPEKQNAKLESKDKQIKLQMKTSSEDVTNAELKKIEKKKAKKLAVKLKIQQKKSQNKDLKKATAASITEEKSKNLVFNLKDVKKDLIDTKSAMANDEQKPQTLDTAANKNYEATSSKVLTKKEKKSKKRQIIKDQKLAEKQTRDPAVDSATVFVGNLPVNTKRLQLIRIFKKFGPVNFIRLRSAGGQMLFKHKQRKMAGSLNAYVALTSKDKAEKSLSLNGVEFKGNHLRVTLASKKTHSEENYEAKRTVFVGNLKYSASEESLREIFSSCGEIDYVRCIRDGDKGCKGVAYVCFKTADAVGLALELNKTIVDERPINVERYSVKKLGAKQSREAQAEKENKNKKGAKLRLEGKVKKEKPGQKLENQGEVIDAKKSKKSEFRGVKVEGLKKKQKSKKKKSNNQMLQLAKKIAPKPKNEQT